MYRTVVSLLKKSKKYILLHFGCFVGIFIFFFCPKSVAISTDDIADNLREIQSTCIGSDKIFIDTVLKNYDRYSEYFEGCKYSYDVFKDETKCDCFKYLMMQKVFFHEYEEYTPILYGIYRDCDREFIENLKKIVMTRDDSEEFNDRTFFPSFSDLEIFKELKLF